MTVDTKKSEKRGYVASSDEEDAEKSSSGKLGEEYHRCVMSWVKKLNEIGEEKLSAIEWKV